MTAYVYYIIFSNIQYLERSCLPFALHWSRVPYSAASHPSAQIFPHVTHMRLLSSLFMRPWFTTMDFQGCEILKWIMFSFIAEKLLYAIWPYDLPRCEDTYSHVFKIPWYWHKLTFYGAPYVFCIIFTKIYLILYLLKTKALRSCINYIRNHFSFEN